MKKILLIFLIIVLFISLATAQTITLTQLNITGELCNDKESKIIFSPLNSNEEIVSVDEFQYFIKPNQSFYKNKTTLFHETEKPYILILNLTNHTVSNLTFYGQAEQRGKTLKTNLILFQKQCLGKNEKIQKNIFSIENYVQDNWIYLLLFFVGIISLIILIVLLEKIKS